MPNQAAGSAADSDQAPPRWLTMSVTVDDVTLAVYELGRGPHVLCLAALGHDHHDFDEFAQRMSSRCTVVCLEWPGHGRSGPDHEDVSAARYADLVSRVLDQLDIRAPVVVGNSIGGAAAIRVASVRPVRGLVLASSGGLVPITPLVSRVCVLMQRFFAAGERGAWWFPPLFGLYYRSVLTQPASRVQRQRIVQGSRRVAPLLRQGWTSFGRPEADIRHLAAMLEVPVWVAWAKHDRTVPLSRCMPAIRAMKRATLTTFPCGHTPFLEQPAAFAEGFAAFASTLEWPQ